MVGVSGNYRYLAEITCCTSVTQTMENAGSLLHYCVTQLFILECDYCGLQYNRQYYDHLDLVYVYFVSGVDCLY